MLRRHRPDRRTPARRAVLGAAAVATSLVTTMAATGVAGQGPPAAARPHEPPSAAATQSPPNVVVLLLDDARLDDMSVLRDVRTRVANRGVTVTRHYAPFPLCCPARATLLTGRYAHNHGVLSNEAPGGGFAAFDDASTLATWLDPTYRTGLVGKYLNQYARPYVPPGWDEWMVPYRMYDYDHPEWWIARDALAGRELLSGYQTDTIGSLAADFVRRNAPSARPFFLMADIVAPHAGNPRDPDDPSMPTPSVSPIYRNRFAGEPLTDPSFNEADVTDKPAQLAPLTPAEIRAETEVNAQRRESLLSAQDALNDVIDALDDSGELSRTFVIVTSDNGYLLGEHRIRSGKMAPYEVANHMPLFIRGPGIPAGTSFSGLTSQVDLAPTIARMAAVPLRAAWRLDGESMLYRVRHPAAAPSSRPGVLLEATMPGDTDSWQYRGVVSGRWKYVERATGQVELYDLTADPYELDSLGADPAYAARRNRLAGILADLQDCAAAGCLG